MPQILLVEPSRPQRQSHVDALRKINATQVVIVDDSWQALQRAAQEPFDVIIADMVLPKPGLSGADTLLRLGEFHPQARTILFTEHDCTADLLTETCDVFLSSAGDPAAFTRQLIQATLHDSATGRGAPEPDGEDAPTLARSSLGQDPQNKLIAGKYRLINEIGRGGMGIVYRAEDTFIGRPVAVKLLHLQASRQTAHLEQRMRLEVTIAGQLEHPNIVTVFEAGVEGDELFLVMQLLTGETLRQVLERGPRHKGLPRDQAIDILRQVLSAFDYAHGRGVVHRDLKPENIFLTSEGQVKIVDFGLAKLMSIASSDESESLNAPESAIFDPTTGSMLLGTMAYMAPEQMFSSKIDHRVDLYSLGVVLFELIDGRPLGTVAPQLARMSAFKDGTAEPPLPHLEGEEGLTRVFHKAVAARPEDRYQSAESFTNDLLANPPPADPGWRQLLPRLPWVRK